MNDVYQGQFVLTHYLSRTFKQLWSSINKRWAIARKTVTNMLVDRLPGPRVFAKGYLQKRTSDFNSFSPTTPQVTLRVILALTAMLGSKSWDLDVTCAFISAPLPKGQKLCEKPIEGYLLPKGKVLKLLKTIYGLIQAPLVFYLLCSKVYTKVGYTQLKSDECVFVRQEDNVRKGSKSAKNRQPIVSQQKCQLYQKKAECSKVVSMNMLWSSF